MVEENLEQAALSLHSRVILGVVCFLKAKEFEGGGAKKFRAELEEGV